MSSEPSTPKRQKPSSRLEPYKMSPEATEYFDKFNSFDSHTNWDLSVRIIRERKLQKELYAALTINSDINVALDAYCSAFVSITSDADCFLFDYVSKKKEYGESFKEIQFEFCKFLLRNTDEKKSSDAKLFIKEKALELLYSGRGKVITWNSSKLVSSSSIYVYYNILVKCVAFLYEYVTEPSVDDFLLHNFLNTLLDLPYSFFESVFMKDASSLISIISGLFSLYKDFKIGSFYLNKIQEFYKRNKGEDIYANSRIRKMVRLSTLNIIDLQTFIEFSIDSGIPQYPIHFKAFDLFSNEYGTSFINNLNCTMMKSQILCSDTHFMISLEENLKYSVWSPILSFIFEKEFSPDIDINFILEFSISALNLKQSDSLLKYKVDYALAKTLDIGKDNKCFSKEKRRKREAEDGVMGCSEFKKILCIPYYLCEVATENLFEKSYHKDHEKICLNMSMIIIKKIGCMENFPLEDIAKIRVFGSLCAGSQIEHLISYPILYKKDASLHGFSIGISSSRNNWRFNLFSVKEESTKKCDQEPTQGPNFLPEPENNANILEFQDCPSYQRLSGDQITSESSKSKKHFNKFPSYFNYNYCPDTIASIISVAKDIKQYSIWFDEIINDSRFNPLGDVEFLNVDRNLFEIIGQQDKSNQSSSPSKSTSIPSSNKSYRSYPSSESSPEITLTSTEKERSPAGIKLENGRYLIEKPYKKIEEQILKSPKPLSDIYHYPILYSSTMIMDDGDNVGKKIISYEMEVLENINTFIENNLKIFEKEIEIWAAHSVAYLVDILSSLLCIHKDGYVHGDISFNNIGRSIEHDCWKIFDFGQSFHSSKMTERIGSGGTRGYRDYLSYDEQKGEGVFNKSSDLCSLMRTFMLSFTDYRTPKKNYGKHEIAYKIAAAVCDCKSVEERPSVSECLSLLLDEIEKSPLEDKYSFIYAKSLERGRTILEK